MIRGTMQMKFTVEAETAAAFKARCAANGVSMASVVSRWMKEGRPSSKNSKAKADTRPQRRASVHEAIDLLSLVLDNEEFYRDAIPEQFQTRRDVAEQACEQLAQAISCLEDAY